MSFPAPQAADSERPPDHIFMPCFSGSTSLHPTPAPDRRRALQAVGALALAAALPGCGRPEPLLRVATNRWAGYQFIHLAQDLGLYDPLRVRAIEMPNATDTLRALTAGTVEGAGLTLDELISVRADGLDLVAVLVFGESAGADALMAQAEVQSVADLRGRSVALEASPVAGLLLDAALRVAGLAPDDVQRVYLPATEHLQAWQAQQVAAIVSHEPHVQALAAQGGLRLFDSREMPGAILDVLAVHRSVLDHNLDGLRLLVAGHFAALAQWGLQRAQVEPQLATRLALPAAQVGAALHSLKLPHVAANHEWLGGPRPRLQASALSLERSMRATGLLRAPVPMAGLTSALALPASAEPQTMRRTPWPLRWALPLALAVLLTLISAINVWLAMRQSVAAVDAQAEADLRLLVHRLERHAADKPLPDNTTLWADVAEARTDPRVVAVHVIDGRGSIVLSAERAWIGQPAADRLPGYTDARLQQALREMPPDLRWEPGPQRLSALLSNHWITGGDHSPQAQPLAIYAVMSLQAQRADARWLAVRHRVPDVLSALALMVLLGAWLQRQVARPLARLEDSSRRLAQGDASARAEPRGVGEVRQLGLAFNTMAEAQQRAQADLRASEERLATILYSTGDALLATDTAQRITLMNPVAEALTGWREHEARGRPVSEVFRIEHAHTGAPAAIPVERVLSDGAVVGLANHTVLVSRQGVRTHIADSAAPIRRGDGQLTGVVLVFRDVNETYRIEQALADSEWHYRVLANAGQALVFTADAKGGSLWCNDAWLRFSGHTRERAVAGGWVDAVHPDDHAKLRAQWQQAARDGQSGSEILRLYRVDGEMRWYLTEVVSRRDSAGQHAGLIVRALDVTAQRDSDARLQAQVDELQRWHRAMLGREARVGELKREVNAVLAERGAAPRYPDAEADADALPHTAPDSGAAAAPPPRP